MPSTLPAAWYRDPAVYERERHEVWAAEWVVLCAAAELARPGQYVATALAGWPLFVVVDPDGRLRGYHNVCPHRAGVIVWPGTGVAGNLVCRYHGWAFGWDGALRSARDFGDDPGLCVGEQRLRAIRVERWRNLVFACLDLGAPPLADALGMFADECTAFPMDGFHHHRRLVRELACNWKTYADNYLEGYHVPLLHPSLARALDMSTYTVDVHRDGYCVHRADTPHGSPSAGRWLFRYPNLAINLYASGMNVERIVPMAPDRTQVLYDYFGLDDDPASIEAMVAMSNVVLDEDQAICEAVQRNLDAGVYHAGRLSPRHETALAWFQGRIAVAIGER